MGIGLLVLLGRQGVKFTTVERHKTTDKEIEEEPGSANNNRTDTAYGFHRFGVAIISLLLFYIGVFHELSNMPLNEELLYGVHERFWQQPNIVAFVALGIGFAAVVEVTIRIVRGSGNKKEEGKGKGKGGGSGSGAVLGLAVAVVVWMVQQQVRKTKHRRRFQNTEFIK